MGLGSLWLKDFTETQKCILKSWFSKCVFSSHTCDCRSISNCGLGLLFDHTTDYIATKIYVFYHFGVSWELHTPNTLRHESMCLPYLRLVLYIYLVNMGYYSGQVGSVQSHLMKMWGLSDHWPVALHRSALSSAWSERNLLQSPSCCLQVKPRSHCADLAVPISTIWKIVDIGMVGSWSRGNIVLTSWKSARSGNDRQWSGSQYDKVLL